MLANLSRKGIDGGHALPYRCTAQKWFARATAIPGAMKLWRQNQTGKGECKASGTFEAKERFCIVNGHGEGHPQIMNIACARSPTPVPLPLRGDGRSVRRFATFTLTRRPPRLGEMFVFPLLALSLAFVALPALAQQPAPAPTAANPVAEFRAFGEIAVYPRREAPATVVARNETRLAAEISAVVSELSAEPGEVVAKGAVLARLDARDSELALERARAAEQSAKARLALAETQLKRARELKAEGFISQEALNQRETETAVVAADLRAATAALVTAQRSLEKCVLRAPFKAIVKTRSGQVGELAAVGTPLYTLLDAERLEVAAAVPVLEAASLAQAKEWVFVGQDGRFALSLLRVSPAIDRAARTREARLAFKSKAPLPGAEGRLEWREAQAHLPGEYLLRRGKELGVFVEDGGKARFLALPEAQEGRPVAFASPAGTRIATQNRNTLTDGQLLAPGAAAGRQ